MLFRSPAAKFQIREILYFQCIPQTRLLPSRPGRPDFAVLIVSVYPVATARAPGRLSHALASGERAAAHVWTPKLTSPPRSNRLTKAKSRPQCDMTGVEKWQNRRQRDFCTCSMPRERPNSPDDHGKQAACHCAAGTIRKFSTRSGPTGASTNSYAFWAGCCRHNSELDADSLTLRINVRPRPPLPQTPRKQPALRLPK